MVPGEPASNQWEGDVNAAAREEWQENTTAFDRVRTTADVTTEPRTAGEIADRAAVSEPTARKHLTSLAEAGRVERVETDGGTKYHRSPQSVATRRVAAIHRTHSKQELQSSIQDLQTEVGDLEETYGVSDVDSLVTDVDDDGRWPDVARWRQIEENLQIAKAALHLYDFDPDGGRERGNRDRDLTETGESRQRGAFGAGESGQPV